MRNIEGVFFQELPDASVKKTSPDTHCIIQRFEKDGEGETYPL